MHKASVKKMIKTRRFPNQFDHKDVCFIAASCKTPDKISSEVLSRFNERIQLRNPSREERLEIFQKHASWIGDSLDRDEIRLVTDVCHGFVAGNMVLMSSRGEEVKLVEFYLFVLKALNGLLEMFSNFFYKIVKLIALYHFTFFSINLFIYFIIFFISRIGYRK